MNDVREALITTITLNGGVPLPLSSEQLTCLRQVEGEMTQLPTLKKILGWPIQAFFWLEWGCCGPNLSSCHYERSRGICSSIFRVQ